jgi:peptidyl-dipeptidase Dcp
MNPSIPSPALADAADNPFFQDWTGPFGAPPFGRIAPAHFPPAFDQAFAAHDAEVAAIAADPAAPGFDNTIAALELSGRRLGRVTDVFRALAGANSNPALLQIERDIAPRRARHWDGILHNAHLFARIDALYRARDQLGLTAEQQRVLERYHLDFKRAGAALAAPAKARLAAINERLASLGTTFSQNVLADEQAYTLVLEAEADLAGLPDYVRAAARAAAQERGLAHGHVVTLSRSSVEPFLQFSARRDLREKAFRAWIARGEGGGATDNKAIIAEMVALRAERAALLGYETFAHYRLDDAMAKTPAAVRGLLEQVWAPARARARADRDELAALAQQQGGNFELAAWDWRYYAEKLRKQRYDLDESEIKPYLQLPKMIEAAFHTASRLFGLSFRERHDVPVYHPDVRVFEVMRDRTHVGLFYGDYFARSSKRGGAWMSSFRDQENLKQPVTPIVVNTCNFPKSDPALLSFDEARTLFHEFGHALHGLLSQVRFPRLSGTNVARDFVELPSQIFEHWLEEPAILERFAVHCETGKPMPKALLEKLVAARNFNQGFATVEYLTSAFVDLDWHALAQAPSVDATAFEAETLKKLEAPKEIVMRHASPHFLHVFGGDGYSAGYYSYMWSEVLDADGFAAFKEKKDPFDAPTAQRLHDFIYSSGGTRDFADAYRAFRGRDPKIDALLDGRGLA